MGLILASVWLGPQTTPEHDRESFASLCVSFGFGLPWVSFRNHRESCSWDPSHQSTVGTKAARSQLRCRSPASVGVAFVSDSGSWYNDLRSMC